MPASCGPRSASRLRANASSPLRPDRPSIGPTSTGEYFATDSPSIRILAYSSTAGEQLRVQGTDHAKALGTGRVAIRMRPGRIDNGHVQVHLRPVVVVRRRGRVRGRKERQNAAGVGQRLLTRSGGLAVLFAEEPAPGLRLGGRIVEQPAPEPIPIEILLVVARRTKRGIRVGIAPAGQTGAFAAFERQRLEQLHAIAATEAGGSAVPRRHGRIAPEQKPLRAGPHAVQNAVGPVLGQQVAIAIAEEAPRAGAFGEEALVLSVRPGQFDGANGGLMIRQAHVLGPDTSARC